jgi:hypothetical protein
VGVGFNPRPLLIGDTMTKMKAMLVVGLLTAGAVFAADITVDDKSVGTATYTLTQDGTDMTLTVDKIASDSATPTDLTVADDLIVGDDATVSGKVTVVESVTTADILATDDVAIVDDLSVTGDVSIVGSTTINSGSTLSGQATSGTSKYNLSIVPVGSVAGFAGRVDGVHIGSEANANCTTGQMVGAYVSVGRPAGANAAAAYPGGAPDTGFRSVCINKATNNATTYGIMGAFVKAKNYTTAVVKSVIGLRVEAINDGTDTAGESAVIELSTDSSVVDYGIDMDEMATPALGEIRFSNGTMLRVNTTNLIMVSADGATTNTFVQQ